jgi:hypothetical protein
VFKRDIFQNAFIHFHPLDTGTYGNEHSFSLGTNVMILKFSLPKKERKSFGFDSNYSHLGRKMIITLVFKNFALFADNWFKWPKIVFIHYKNPALLVIGNIFQKFYYVGY